MKLNGTVSEFLRAYKANLTYHQRNGIENLNNMMAGTFKFKTDEEAEQYLADLRTTIKLVENCAASISGNMKHGESRTRTYQIWSDIKVRCKRHGSISLHPTWETYEGFVADMGRIPDGMTVARIDRGGDYTPDNCQLTAVKPRASEKNIGRKFDGLTMSEWARELGVSPSALYARVSKYGTPTPDKSKMRYRLEWRGKPLSEWAVDLGVGCHRVRYHYHRHGSLEKLIAKLETTT